MKRFLFLCSIAMAVIATPVFAADVGVSVTVGQPGFYGHIDIGNVPRPPQLIFPEPVIIHPVAVGVALQPIYLHVPPGHEKHWGKHCQEYNACGQRVYFVHESWYNDEYVPHYQREHGRGKGHDKDRGKGHDKGEKGHGKDKD